MGVENDGTTVTRGDGMTRGGRGDGLICLRCRESEMVIKTERYDRYLT